MLIVIPMAGLSRRFAEAGYKIPKYMLEAGGKSLFWHSVNSFKKYFDKASFMFIYRDVQDTGKFVFSECRKLGIADMMTVCLENPTRGQAETVVAGLRTYCISDATELLIFNIDTIRKEFDMEEVGLGPNVDGYIEVFEESGENWSFVRPVQKSRDRVAETAEKRRISNLCSTGLYYFRRAGDLIQAFDEEAKEHSIQANEFYVAPLYNRLIRRGQDIRYHKIERNHVLFSGVPEEYEIFRHMV